MVHEAEPIPVTAEEKKPIATGMAEDVAYVTNHAISCGITDTVIQPPIGAYVQSRIESNKIPKWFRWIKNIFESHEAHHDHPDPHSGFKGNAKHWFLGEAMGDIGAIPLTVLTQRYAPGFMNLIRRLSEPVLGGRFRSGAERNARSWAATHGFAENGEEAKAKAAELYEYELKHLPQAFVWNLFSIPINLFTQRATGNKASWGTLLTGKIFGSVISNGLLIGGRMLSPKTFGAIDKLNEHVSLPVTNAVVKTLGMDGHSAEHAAEQQLLQNTNATWAERSTHQSPAMER